jgi:hypothetical protein
MLVVLAACSASEHPSYVARDPCAGLAIISHATTAVERDGLVDALALWRARGVAAFDVATRESVPGSVPGSVIEVRFEDAGSVFRGVYDPEAGQVFINRAIADRTTMAIVIAHELGHVFGLAHIAATTRLSLMNPGNVATPPTDGDQRELESMWGSCE